jgi:xylulokinase
MARLFLGLDSSTQSLSAIVIDYDARQVVYEHSLNFDKALPQYRTQNGVLPHPDPLVKHSPPMMWAEALDLMFEQMRKDGVALKDVLAVAGSGQQHGSVYLKADGRSLARPTSPIWMDSSTRVECAEIRDALGGVAATAEATGSDAFERFTGPQIRKFWKTEPDAYRQTAHIALVSSYMAGLLAGQIAPIDHGDGAGMNLMDIRTKQWHPAALDATAPDLANKLPALVPSRHVIGPVSRRFGLNENALALVWSGDNPCSVIGLGLIREGRVAISLGTSDTYFGLMKQCRVDQRGEGHVFVAPTGDYMTLICFQNGSLARERVREMYGLPDWGAFAQALAATPPGNRGAILLPWFEPEIVPRVHRPGLVRFDLDERDAAANCRAIYEAQMMAMRLHSQWMKVRPTRIYATGGASRDRPLLQVMADVMNCPVSRIEVSKSAALGAALRAAHGYFARSGRPVGWDEIVAGFTEPIPNSEVRPNPAAVNVYDALIEKYARCEAEALRRQ